MFDWIPLESYVGVYYNTMLVIGLMMWLHSMMFDLKNESSIQLFKIIGSIFTVFIMLYIGLRPISSQYFGDMYTYSQYFKLASSGAKIIVRDDYLFNYFLIGCSQIMSVEMFFLVVSVLYILPCYLFARKYFGNYWFFGFYIMVSAFAFWSYGTNGIRNGLASSAFVMALIFYKKKALLYSFFAFSFLFHASMIIPIGAYFVAAQYKNPVLYLQIWLIAIPISFFGGSYFESLFVGLGFEDRVSGYFTNKEIAADQAAIVGFRWDFLLYSASAVFAGWYYIFKKKVNDTFYTHLFGVYTVANAFWILVIRANFSNRFAYLSWFLMAIVIGYPLFRYKLWNDQYRVFGTILFAYYLFTYIMFLRNGY